MGSVTTTRTRKVRGVSICGRERGRAALEAAAEAVAAVFTSQKIVLLGVEKARHRWSAVLECEPKDGSSCRYPAFILCRAAGSFVLEAYGLSTSLLGDVPSTHTTESDCSSEERFVRHITRTMFEWLHEPKHIRAILALARELLTRVKVPADEATALIQQHLTSA